MERVAGIEQAQGIYPLIRIHPPIELSALLGKFLAAICKSQNFSAKLAFQ
ncbi:hypothetical protein OSCI_2650001 [Kamptonema sp. PCC 6506]|nr:hypothetical protein OSCI_2650001 [Kamptonema sp. PCC 6506]